MRLRQIAPFSIVIAVGILLWMTVPWFDLLQWSLAQQREFQNAMARGLRAIRDGEPRALWLLCSATATYGVVHAIGPGHGKVLLGGAAFASGATLRRLAVLTIVSSLAQSVTAILIVGVMVFGAQFGAAETATVTETWLAPFSVAMIGAIGTLLVLRGVRSIWNLTAVSHEHSCTCGHAHGPTLKEVKSLDSFRDAVVLVTSIAIRPCTGALFVLAIAARFDAFAAGCLAVLAMGLGTAAFNLIVATSGAASRRFALINQGAGSGSALRLSALFHIIGGSAIVAFSISSLLA